MIAVELRNVSKSHGRVPVLRDLNLSVEAGAFTVIFGAPACGKSVLVRLLTGLEKPTAGQVLLRGEDAASLAPGDRNIGYVPQSFALYPHYSVRDNIAYPLTLIGVPKTEIETTVRQVSEQIKIDHLLDKRPDQLSGGEKQRVALARGMVKHTDIFVLDDSLVGLDFKLREQLFDDLRQMQEDLEATFIYTTSDPLETLALADQVAVLDAGSMVDIGPVEEIYWHPQHLRTMELLGYPTSNLLSGKLVVQSNQVRCRTSLFEFPVELNQPDSAGPGLEDVTVVIRPQDVGLGMDGQDGRLLSQAQVMLRDDLGGEIIAYLDVEGMPLVTVVPHAKDHLVSEDSVTIGVRPSALVLFDSGTGQRIGHGA